MPRVRQEFYGIPGTRDYMNARYALGAAMVKAQSRLGVEKALEHYNDMLRLCRPDNMGIRHMVPALQLRLGLEQECYDGQKWWATTGSTKGYDWFNMEQPHMDIRGADVLEDMPFFEKDDDTSNLVPLTLLKLRLLLELEQLQAHGDADGSSDPYDRPIGSTAREIWGRDKANVQSAIDTLKKHYTVLFKRVHEVNEHFWSLMLLEPEETLRPMYTYGSPEEAMLVLDRNQRAFEETKDAIPLIDVEYSKMTTGYQGTADNTESIGEVKTLEKRRGHGQGFPWPMKTRCRPNKIFTLAEDRLRFVRHDLGPQVKQVLVYIAGARSTDGKQFGWSVACGSTPERQCILSGRLENKGPFGDQHEATLDRAALRAAVAALRISDWRKEGFNFITIATDSTYVHEGASLGVRTWIHDWMTAKENNVTNRDLWELMLGDVERFWNQDTKIAFWNVKKELNWMANDAALKAANEGTADEEFKDIVLKPISATSGSQTRVLALCLDTSTMLEEAFTPIYSALSSKGRFDKATTPAEARSLLNAQPLPTVIYVNDGAVAKSKKAWDRILDLCRKGATVILAGAFSSFVNPQQFKNLFAKAGLTWTSGSYHRATVKLRSQNVPSSLAGRLPATDNQKCLYAANVKSSDIWYAESDNSTEAAVAVAKIGNGRLAYLGDVNGEAASVAVISALLGPVS